MYGTHKKNMARMRKIQGAANRKARSAAAVAGTNSKGPKPPYPPR
jgi:hypothetical protein